MGQLSGSLNIQARRRRQPRPGGIEGDSRNQLTFDWPSILSDRKLRQSIFSLRILARSVCGLIRSSRAAPCRFLSNTMQFMKSSTASATSPSASAIWQATADVKQQPTQQVPKHLKDSHYQAAKKAGFGVDYKYPHDYRDGFVPQEYLPAQMKKRYYTPKESGYEKDIKRYLQKLKSLIQNSRPVGDSTTEKDA